MSLRRCCCEDVEMFNCSEICHSYAVSDDWPAANHVMTIGNLPAPLGGVYVMQTADFNSWGQFASTNANATCAITSSSGGPGPKRTIERMTCSGGGSSYVLECNEDDELEVGFTGETDPCSLPRPAISVWLTSRIYQPPGPSFSVSAANAGNNTSTCCVCGMISGNASIVFGLPVCHAGWCWAASLLVNDNIIDSNACDGCMPPSCGECDATLGSRIGGVGPLSGVAQVPGTANFGRLSVSSQGAGSIADGFITLSEMSGGGMNAVTLSTSIPTTAQCSGNVDANISG